MRLSHRDFDLLQQAILELYDYRDSETFRRAVPDIFLKIIPADFFGLTEYAVDPKARSAKLVDWIMQEWQRREWTSRRMERMLFIHPFTGHFARTGDTTALKHSDFFTLPQLRDWVMYQEGFRHLGIERNLAVPVASRVGAAAINLSGKGKDFTERDRLILNLLRPHFDQARRNAELATAQMTAGAKALAAYELSPREAEIAHWVAEGKTNPEIALILKSSPRTVEKHMERILEKLGVENRTTAAVMIARANATEPKAGDAQT